MKRQMYLQRIKLDHITLQGLSLRNETCSGITDTFFYYIFNLKCVFPFCIGLTAVLHLFYLSTLTSRSTTRVYSRRDS